MWDCPDSQDVGLEAATIERVRNSSLVEWSRADNVPGLKPDTEAADPDRGDPIGVVGERRTSGEVELESSVERVRERMPV